jgi:hypothetical protein
MIGKLFKGFRKKESSAPIPKAPAPAQSQPQSQPQRRESPAPPQEPTFIKPEEPKSSEELCGINPDMNPDEIRARLSVLYKRHNAAASSLDANLREEAEEMLDAIVEVRHSL